MLVLENMKEYQAYTGITNAQIARDLDIQPMAVSRFFNGDNPKYEDLIKYSKYFGVNLAFFENSNFDPSVVLGLDENEDKEAIFYSGSLSSHDPEVLKTVENIVDLFKHLNLLIMDHGMRL